MDCISGMEIEYVCEQCHFRCVKKSNYTTHVKTRKHQLKMLNMPSIAVKTEFKPTTFFCCEKCRKQYKTRSGLWRHQQICRSGLNDDNHSEQSEQNSYGEIYPVCLSNTPTTEMLNMIYDLVKQNQEIKEMLLKQNEQIIEYTKRPVFIQQNINNTMNNHFSLNVFLQEKCKGAINMSDFVNTLNIEMNDLEMVGKIGYVEGISRIIVNELSRLDIYTRPIHCTDTKRETIYIKDSDKWTRDTETKEYTKKVIEKVANKNLNKIPEWKRKNPRAEIMDTKEHELNMSIMIQSLGGLGGTSKDKTEKNQEKIIKLITKEIYVNKELMLETI